ncbi:hypothetical protein [uncultured Hoeflea sp.]|uniref:hypothetical protein n=1 Tax=uncultured Hoeflea sp. TaxID=538666 RepID=UPI002610ADF7|nr:hypothetical protein [uncultured Hoeflea sp.]
MLTGEHKIKASLLKAEFGSRHTVIAGKDAPKVLQSPRSKHLHFNAKICKECNSFRTQPSDIAFDMLHAELKQLRDKGVELTDKNNRPNYRLPPEVETNSFRYFAKILCCFLAEVHGPRSRSLSAFALGLSDMNPILLQIRKDEEYEASLTKFETQGYAQHGGLKFRFDDRKKWVQSIDSSLSVGGIRYDFWVQLRWLSKLELHYRFGDLIRTALVNGNAE